MDTREKILSTASALFAQKGYANASIRDICGQVGIKESSLYFHFKNKQAILSELADRFTRDFSASLDDFAATMRRMSYLSPTLFRDIITRYLHSCYCEQAQFIRILIHEQAQDEALRALYEKWLYDEPCEVYREMFMSFIEMGFIRRTSVSLLADAFHAPILALFFRHMTVSAPQTFEQEALLHVERFLKEFQA